MKRCSRCRESKPFTAFSRNRGENDGRHPYCKPCHKEYRASRPKREKTPEQIAARKARWEKYSKENREAIRKRKQRYLIDNRPKINEYQRRHGAKRRASKLNAMPAWVDKKAIDKVYLEAEIMTRITGVEHHVDHIIPLRGRGVCGLHVPANLRVVTAEFNWKKGNKFRG